ncbi:MAG TPA: chitosanase [Albitalea sp.]|uniref:chitosanase n=1 Tax=Piscinibacter sp. TaxID=1903157 RepID=UPI002ED38954
MTGVLRARMRWALILGLTAVGACGGGGSDAETAAQAESQSVAHDRTALAVTWTHIANEGQAFTVSGVQTVRYGSGSKWVEKSVSGSGKCSNGFFGKDPAVGVKKQCQVKGSSTPPPGSDLTDARKKDIAMQIVSSAENSSLDWKAQYAYIEDIGDGRGYTAGIIGFCSGTGDMLELVEAYSRTSPSNVLSKYLPALRRVNGSASHSGLDPNFPRDWRAAAQDTVFRQAQDHERDTVYFNPAVGQAKADGLRALGQFIYYDAIVMHGPGEDSVSFGGIRKAAMSKAKTPAQGGSEVTYLNAFLDARVKAMKTEEAHSDTSRVDTAQRVFLNNGNLDLNTPLSWKVYGDSYTIR